MISLIHSTRPLRSLAKFGRSLARSKSGVAMTEFAFTLPFLLGAGMMGMEVANRAVVQMKLSQLAIQIADNASRVGEQAVIDNRRIFESDINDLLHGASVQGGNLDLYDHGRVILSSLEVVPDTTDDNYIHWQRCMGKKRYNSSYGDEGDGLSGATLTGMGPAGKQVSAFGEEAVMFVEIAYDYQSLIGTDFGLNPQMTAIASFNVRADRDLSQIYPRDPASPDPIADCDTFGGSLLAR